MAYFGLRYPIIAKYDRSTGIYSNGFVCGKAVSLEITPNYSEGSLYGDDEQAEYEKEIISNREKNRKEYKRLEREFERYYNGMA